jgi:hypothetical protein
MYLDAATNQDETKRQQDYACRDRSMGVRMWLGEEEVTTLLYMLVCWLVYHTRDDVNGGFACGGGVKWSGGGFVASRPLHCDIPARHPLESLRVGERSGSMPPTSHSC